MIKWFRIDHFRTTFVGYDYEKANEGLAGFVQPITRVVKRCIGELINSSFDQAKDF